jgi:hypothetical protein
MPIQAAFIYVEHTVKMFRDWGSNKPVNHCAHLTPPEIRALNRGFKLELKAPLTVAGAAEAISGK